MQELDTNVGIDNLYPLIRATKVYVCMASNAHVVVVEREIDVNGDKVWDACSNLATTYKWTREIVFSELVSNNQRGFGAQVLNTRKDSTKFTTSITEWNESDKFFEWNYKENAEAATDAESTVQARAPFDTETTVDASSTADTGAAVNAEPAAGAEPAIDPLSNPFFSIQVEAVDENKCKITSKFRFSIKLDFFQQFFDEHAPRGMTDGSSFVIRMMEDQIVSQVKQQIPGILEDRLLCLEYFIKRGSEVTEQVTQDIVLAFLNQN